MNECAAWAEQARAVRIEDEIARRGIRLRGGIDRCGPCPVCGGTDGFSINLKKQVFNCRRGSTGGDVIALVKHLDSVGYLDVIAHLAGAPPQRTDCSIRKQPDHTFKQHEDKSPGDTWPRGLALWLASAHPRRTLVERYLKSRSLELPDEAANEAIRFDPNCSFEYGERFPAMICLVRNIVTNEPQGIHRTALTADGTAIKRPDKAGRLKTFRKALGSISGGAIKLDPDEDVTQGLCIGEGVETCLAGRQMGLWPVWSVVNTSGIEKFPILSSLDGLHIFKENDPGGESAKVVEACARRWYEAGRDVIIVEPDTAKDLNDELREAAG
jgi:putative DNA primase/helicase